MTLSSKQNFIIARLEELFNQWDIPRSPSDMFIGGLFAMQPKLRANPDWMSQSANSFREIFYHLLNKNNYKEFPKGIDKKLVAFENYGSLSAISEDIGKLGFLYNKFTEIAHHNLSAEKNEILPSASEYENFVLSLEKELHILLTRQLDIHEKIELLISNISKSIKIDNLVQEVRSHIESNLDACQYFFTHITADTLPIFVKQGFYNNFHWSKTFHDSDRWTSFELFSLERLAPEAPEEVAHIFLNHQIENDTNPFATRTSILRCMKSFSSQYLRQVFEYLYDNGWTLPSKKYSDDYILEDIAKKIVQNNDWETFLIYLKYRFSPLVSLPQNDYSWSSREYCPFIFDTQFIENTFEGLSKIPNDYQKKCLVILLEIFNKTLIHPIDEQTSGLQFQDNTSFLSYDLTQVSIQDVKDYDKGIMDKLLGTYIRLAKKYIIHESSSEKTILEIINKSPESPILWKLKYILLSFSLPKFESQFVEETLRFTKYQNPFEYLSGAEYETTLAESFHKLSARSKSTIFQRLIAHFKENSDNSSHFKIYANRIFSVISSYLNHKQLKEIVGAGIEIMEGYKPSPTLGQVTAGFVVDQSPITLEELSSLSVLEIIKNLHYKWHPNEILKVSSDESFLKPINANGLALLIIQDLHKRPEKYLEKLNEFIKPKKLSLTYTYRMLEGLAQLMKKNDSFSNYNKIIDFISTIVVLESQNKLIDIESNQSQSLRNAYEPVSNLMIFHGVNEVIQQLLDSKTFISKTPELSGIEKVRKTLELLLKHENPKVLGEELVTASSTIRTGGGPTVVSDSYFQAINSVRGAAFSSYVFFLRKLESQVNLKFADYSNSWRDVLELFIKSEKTRALHFMFGLNTDHLISLDKKWYYKELSFLWDDSLPYHLQLHVWNGFLHTQPWTEYLSNITIRKRYIHWITNTPKPESDRKYSKDFEKALANHFFSYYIHKPEEFHNSDLFAVYFKKGTLNSHIHFIDLIGRYAVSRINKLDINKWPPNLNESLFLLWEQYLDEYTNDNLFEHFSFWYLDGNKDFEIERYLDLIIKTLKKSSGKISFSHILEKELIQYTAYNPLKTLKIVELVLLEGYVRSKSKHHFYLNDVWKQFFKSMYKSSQKTKTKALVSRLIQEGGASFWILKEEKNYNF
ncbi:hypothetical protein QRD02_13135 [Aequorivita sp. SDUM287046]|uniref:ATP-binding protein n=1 Tax=Aequorivita aurantiaca TaxID=3053356 RepID=A0ABT8DIW5_9FLAO|nr:hypothetical protein [Aequorivita aurantiaca]MDN3725325.1 hypothetical protein [Aequorivita aurantiaca]